MIFYAVCSTRNAFPHLIWWTMSVSVRMKPCVTAQLIGWIPAQLLLWMLNVRKQYGAFMVAPKGNALSHHVYRFLSVNSYFFIIYNMPSLKWSQGRATFNAFLVASQVRDREKEDDIEGEGQSEGAGDEAGDEARDEAGDEAGECRPEKNSRD